MYVSNHIRNKMTINDIIDKVNIEIAKFIVSRCFG